MLKSTAALLSQPETGQPLTLDVLTSKGDHVVDGRLVAPDGSWYPIIDGLPKFQSDALKLDLTGFCAKHGLDVPTGGEGDDLGQAQTNVTFSDKWRRFRNYGLEPSHQVLLQNWFVKKFGLKDRDDLKAFYNGFGRILEAGPGSGFNARFMAENSQAQVFTVDISEAAETAKENFVDYDRCQSIQADLFKTPFADESFDFVIADGVLHHTPSTYGAVKALYRKVKLGGTYFFYVYKKMGAARYFVDQHIREEFKKLTPEECYAACEGITEMGRELQKVNATVTLEKPVDVLGIPAGTHDVQRLFYYNFIKCYWNDAFDYETNNMVNYDWYHPHHAWQHTEDEVRGWLKEMGVTDFEIHDANPNGISVLLKKPG